MKTYINNFLDKVKESAISTVPFFLIITILYLIFLPFSIFGLLSIVIATILMIIGMALFNVGVDMSTMKMGGYVGSNLSKSRRFKFMLILSFILGFIVTIAEPDLMVLAEQVPGISSKWVIVISVSLGTGIFLLLSTIRTIFRWNIRTILILSYAGALVLALIVQLTGHGNFIPLSYDSIGVTTGNVSVPFIMAFGLGICAVRSGKNNQDDGFGLIALASIGPVISVLIVSLFIKPADTIASDTYSIITNAGSLGSTMLSSILSYLWEVFIVIIPIFAIFLIYNFRYLKLPKSALLRIFIGILYTYIGLVIFLTGVSTGYLTTAGALGQTIAEGWKKWLLIPIGLIIGFFLVFAEPSVHVLNKQVEDITEGIISKKTMLIGISIGVAVSMLIIVFRTLVGIDFMYIMIPLTIIMIVLSIYTPTLFEGIAFDSGGVAAGSLTASFVLPFIIGVCDTLGLNPMLYAFGSVALIAIMPTIVIQIMGIRYQYIVNKNKAKNAPKLKPTRNITIIDFYY